MEHWHAGVCIGGESTSITCAMLQQAQKGGQHTERCHQPPLTHVGSPRTVCPACALLEPSLSPQRSALHEVGSRDASSRWGAPSHLASSSRRWKWVTPPGLRVGRDAAIRRFGPRAHAWCSRRPRASNASLHRHCPRASNASSQAPSAGGQAPSNAHLTAWIASRVATIFAGAAPIGVLALMLVVGVMF